jgi:hypothetical protein
MRENSSFVASSVPRSSSIMSAFTPSKSAAASADPGRGLLQPDRAGHHLGALEGVNQLAELPPVPAHHRIPHFGDEVRRLPREPVRQLADQVGIAGDLGHLAKQRAIHVLLPARSGGRGDCGDRSGEHLIHPARQRSRLDGLGRENRSTPAPIESSRRSVLARGGEA